MNPNANNTGLDVDESLLAENSSLRDLMKAGASRLALTTSMALATISMTQTATAQEVVTALQNPEPGMNQNGDEVIPVTLTRDTLSIDQIIAVSDERYHDTLNAMSLEYIDAMIPVFQQVINIPDEKSRNRAIRRVVNFFESPEEDSFTQMMERLPGYGVTLSEGLVSDLTVFYIAEQLKFGNEIEQTLFAIADRDHMTATMRAQNLIREHKIQGMLLEIERIEANTAEIQANTAETQANTAEIQANTAETQANTAEIQANTAETQANTARLESEILRLRAIQESTKQVIEDLEARPSAA